MGLLGAEIITLTVSHSSRLPCVGCLLPSDSELKLCSAQIQHQTQSGIFATKILEQRKTSSAQQRTRYKRNRWNTIRDMLHLDGNTTFIANSTFKRELMIDILVEQFSGYGPTRALQEEFTPSSWGNAFWRIGKGRTHLFGFRCIGKLLGTKLLHF